MRVQRMLVVLATTVALAGCGDDDGGDGVDAAVVDGSRPDAAGSDGGDVDGGSGSDAGPDAAVVDDCDAPIPALATVEVTSTRFSSPLFVTQPPGSTDLYVVERGGAIRIVRDGAVLGTAFLDVSGLLNGTPRGGDEWGLLGLAFHPEYASNGRFFVNYTPRSATPSGWRNIVAEGRRSAADADRADSGLTTVVSADDDFAGNHNGGMIAFGPDGYLYVATGDGGGQNDPERKAQDLTSLLGKILRVDVSTPGTATPAAGNPFIGTAGARGEIWALGLRNPWRFSFDRATGDFWVGDVGQGEWEEVSLVRAGAPAGTNFGWSAFEGTRAFMGRTLPDGSTHHPPILEYSHEDGLSVVGGYVYRGDAIPALRGVYFYADSYADDYVRAVRVCDGAIAVGPERVPGLERPDTTGAALVSFGEDRAGELYVVYLGSGELRRIVAAD